MKRAEWTKLECTTTIAWVFSCELQRYQLLTTNCLLDLTGLAYFNDLLRTSKFQRIFYSALLSLFRTLPKITHLWCHYWLWNCLLFVFQYRYLHFLNVTYERSEPFNYGGWVILHKSKLKVPKSVNFSLGGGLEVGRGVLCISQTNSNPKSQHLWQFSFLEGGRGRYSGPTFQRPERLSVKFGHKFTVWGLVCSKLAGASQIVSDILRMCKLTSEILNRKAPKCSCTNTWLYDVSKCETKYPLVKGVIFQGYTLY